MSLGFIYLLLTGSNDMSLGFIYLLLTGSNDMSFEFIYLLLTGNIKMHKFNLNQNASLKGSYSRANIDSDPLFISIDTIFIKAPYSSKVDIFFFIQEIFNKLIYSIDRIIKCSI